MSNKGSTKRGIFVIIRGENCGYCHRMKDKIPDIRKVVEAKNLEFKEYNIEKVFTPPGGKYPNALGYLGMWYPFIFYADNQTWSEVLAGKDVRSKLHIMNGSFQGNRYVLGQITYIPSSPAAIDKWLNMVLEKPIMVSSIIEPENLWQNSKKTQDAIELKKTTIKQAHQPIIPRRKYGRNRK